MPFGVVAMASGNAPRPTLMTRSGVLVATRIARTASAGLLQDWPRGEDVARAGVAAAWTEPVQAMPVAMTAATTTARATYVLTSPTSHPPDTAAAPRRLGADAYVATGYPLGHDRIGPMLAPSRRYATIAPVTNVKLSVCIPYKARLDNLKIALEALAQQTMQRR